MPRPNNKRNKCQKRSVKNRANQAVATAVPLVRATHQANAVHSIVPEAASFKPTSTQAVDAWPSHVVLSQPSVSVSDAECQVPQPPESLDNSASITATTKRCVRTVVYNTWSGYSHVPRYLEEPLRFEMNVVPVSAKGRRVLFFFAEEEELAFSLSAENISLSVHTRKEEPFRPQDMKQASFKTTLISAGSDVCEKALDTKIVTQADENHTCVCFTTTLKSQITPLCKRNRLENQPRSPAPTAESKNTPASLPVNRNKVNQSVTATLCEINTTIEMTERIAPSRHAAKQIKRALVLTDSAVDIGTLAMTDTAPKPKPRKASKKLSRGQKRASTAKAAKWMAVRQT
ncbi:hypothetical protein HDU77_007504 [Chytriomyces hyalinus]|nr:hypothetical protein HDU77_007504 [Chytriomyces hyalinus]